ncbi:MAG: SNF1-interacting protein [Pleopsidium flavum]|nr:MAG: SNF1-interacting protein [Pleopsidium flavum]
MGNSATKEQRPVLLPSHSRPGSSRRRTSSMISGPIIGPSSREPNERPSAHIMYSSRSGRGSRPDLSFLGIGSGSDRDTPGLETRRETKQERETRKAERETIAREKQRERSMREENVDGGYLVTQGVYTGIEDYSKAIVRQLMIERRIAPFWKGLNDHSDSWTEHQLVAVVRSLPIPAADEIPPEDHLQTPPKSPSNDKLSDHKHNNLTVPISSRSQSYNSDTSSVLSPSHPTFSLPSPPSPLALPTSTAPLLRGRSKTLASLTTSKNNSQADMIPLELQLPKDSGVNGQPIEAYLYKDAMECPICFLYYPPYLNRTRCCDQSICSECFVQIKRPDPHPPDHNDPTPPTVGSGIEPSDQDADSNLISEPAACPFCVQPEFGITYDPPLFRRGLIYSNQHAAYTVAKAASAMSSSSSLSSVTGNGGLLSHTNPARRRTTSVSATSPTVITTDRVRPDWAQKLSSARSHAARRSAAATALHTAAYLMGNSGQGADVRGFGGFGRRGMLRRGTGADSPSSGTSSTHLNALTLLAERHGAIAARNEMTGYGEHGPTMLAPPPRGSSRRSRIEDLEDMMMMEAIRLSLASEEERRKRGDKEAKKEAKKKGKEIKKAEKAARKTAVYSTSANHSSSGLDGTTASFLNELPTAEGKGKGIDRSGNATPPSPLFNQSNPSHASVPVKTANTTSGGPLATESLQTHLDWSRAQAPPSDVYSSPLPVGCEPQKPSHLRQISNLSSSASSFVESAPGSLKNGLAGSNSSFEASPNASGLHISRGDAVSDTPRSATPGGGAGTEPMFNFRSLAAMIDDEEKGDDSAHIENIQNQGDITHDCYRGESSSNDSPGSSHKVENTGLERSTATLKAEVTSKGSTSNVMPDTPNVKVTSPSQVTLHHEREPDSKHMGEVGILNTEFPQHFYQTTS